jgi:flagellar motor switch protein FliN/FliY
MSSPTTDAVERILRIELPVIAVLAQKRMKLGSILDWNVGSILQLEKHSEELLDLMVNDQCIGRGETVRIGENFGLQVVEMGAVKDTIRKLGAAANETGEPAGPEGEGPAAGGDEPAEDTPAEPSE